MGPTGAQLKDFDELFDCYFQEIPQMPLKMNHQDAVKTDLKGLQQRLKKLTNEKQQLAIEITHLKAEMLCQVQTIKNQQSEELIKFSEQLNSLAIEKADLEKNNQELTVKLMRQQEQIRQLQNET